MNLNDLNFLPEWDDEDYNDEENEGEEWKKKEGKQAAKALYNKWRETFSLIYAFSENLPTDTKAVDQDTIEHHNKQLILENAMLIGPKLRSAMALDLYILKMENAAIVRTNALQLMEQVAFAVLSGFADEDYENVIRESMEEFRRLFAEWVMTFKKDDVEDEWGLFI